MQSNIDSEEIRHFDQHDDWWDPTGSYRPLHVMNPVRLAFIQKHAPLNKQQVLDVGCGGGILSEALCRNGAEVTAIDMSTVALQAARAHAVTEHLPIHYQQITAEDFAHTHVQQYDIVTCMELLEHVPDPAQFVLTCASLLKPQGWLFCSTLNRTLKTFLCAIVGAEYIFGLLPKGTHHYQQCIRPAELAAWGRAAELTLEDLIGMDYSPLTHTCQLSDDVGINYMMAFQKEGNT